MRLTDEAVSEIKAARHVYSAADVARAYDVHRSTVCRIWNSQTHAAVPEASDWRDIETRPRAKENAYDINLMLNSGMTVEEVAAHFNISPRTVYTYRGVWVQ